jgi:hypothetical protein
LWSIRKSTQKKHDFQQFSASPRLKRTTTGVLCDYQHKKKENKKIREKKNKTTRITEKEKDRSITGGTEIEVNIDKRG